MKFSYYIVKLNDTTIVDVAEDMVAAVDKAEQLGYRTAILQGCIITEVGEDPVDTSVVDEEQSSNYSDAIVPEVIDAEEE